MFYFHLQVQAGHLPNLQAVSECAIVQLARHRDKKDPTPIQADTALISGP